jgi:hypothetical protein
MELQKWVSSVATYINRENGDSLKDSFGMLNSHERTWRMLPGFLAEDNMSAKLNQSLLNTIDDDKWIELIIEYAGSMEACVRKEYVGAYKGLSAAYLKLLSIFGGESSSWLLPVLIQSTFDMRVLAGWCVAFFCEYKI